MKIVALLLALITTIGFCVWYKVTPRPIPPNDSLDMTKTFDMPRRPDYTDSGNGVKWHDSLLKYLPKQLDTTVIVYDANNTPLHFRQYIAPVFNKDAFIFQDRGVWRLQRKSKGAADTLKADDFAVARLARWSAFQPDTIKSWQVKFDNIARILNQADRVLVLKSKRELILQRKGKNILSFHLELGKNPVGTKHFENDGKTPEGVYDLDFKQTRTDVYHKSLLISYPNRAQKQYAALHNKKPGMAILIHGTKPNKVKAHDWTNGCIALQNKDMDKLFDYVAEGTLIEIRP